MDKQDELAALIAQARFDFSQSAMPDGWRLYVSDLDHAIAAAVRSFMGSDDARERAAIAVSRADDERLADGHANGFQHEEISDWSLFVADAALSAAIGEDIGGGRG